MLASTHCGTGAATLPGTFTRRCAPRTLSPQRILARGEVLFQEGDTRAPIYRVERGALCHYRHLEDGGHEIIEFAFPGDMVGFGNIDSHVSTAQAIAETVVTVVAPDDLEHAAESDGELASRVAGVADREFEYLRDRAVNSTRNKPVERVASFLSALSHISSEEGRDPTLVTDELSSGYVAEHLNMTIDALARALRELERRGMVRPTASGLQIANIDALEKFTQAA
jgi:CRP/FNR family transcriptional regulator, anaerobic regulatory protein